MPEDTRSAVRLVGPYLMVGVAQLVLTLLAVLVSQVEGLGVRLGIIAVMLIALVNGGLVAAFTMGMRRESRLVQWLAALVLVLIAGLLVWPGWDIGQRGRHF